MTVWSRFARWWARVEPATPLALFRIAIGATVLGEMLSTLRGGALQALWFPPEAGGILPLSSRHWLVGLLGGPSAPLTELLFATTVVGAALLTLGVAARPAALVTLVGAQALFSLHPGTGGGHDRLLTNALWILVFSRADATLSVACRLRTGHWADATPVPAWPRYVLIYQITLVYVATGTAKLSAEWLPWGGWTAVYRALLLPYWARGDWTPIAHVFPLTQVGTAVTWLWEISWFLVPIHLALRGTGRWLGRVDIRAIYVAIGLVMHGILWVAMNLGPFSAATLSFYVLLFGHEAWSRLIPTLRATPQSGASAPAPGPRTA